MADLKIKLSDLKCVCENINLDKYIEFREDIKSKMEYPEWLGDFSKEDLEFMLSNGSKIWVYYDGDVPVCSMMFIPADEKGLKKMELGSYDYKLVGDYGPQFVNFDYQGNGLQLQMLLEMDEYLKSKGLIYGAVTVHPDNIFCIRNIEQDNFKIVSTKEFKRGIRNIYFKEV